MDNRTFYFPRIMDVSINDTTFVLPRDIYICYINSYFKEEERQILLGWENGLQLTEVHYRYLIESFGGKLRQKDGKYEIELQKCYLPQIRIEVFDNIIINVLQPLYDKILKTLFPDCKISLGAWRSKIEEDLQSLNTTLRIALAFTLVNYLYGSNASAYHDFESFFINEFKKRATLVKNLWDTREANCRISYLPVFDNFRNYVKMTPQDVIRIIKNLFFSDRLKATEKKLIETQLIKQAQMVVKHSDTAALDIKNDILHPLVSTQVNIQKAKDFLNSSKENKKQGRYDSSINRCYYSMIRALRSLLAEHKILGPWRGNNLSPDETHKKLERTLRDEIIKKRKIMEGSFLVDFIYVKDQRWVADYADIYLDEAVCDSCIKRAEKFLAEVRKNIITKR